MLKAHLVKYLMHLYSMNKNILITGAAGFIGIHLFKHFLKLGYKLRAVDNFSTWKKDNIKSILNNIKILHRENRDGDVPRSLTSIKKGNNLLNCYPKVDFESGLSKTVNWFWKKK